MTTNEAIIKILQTEPDTDIVPGHDQIWLGKYNSLEYSDYDRKELEAAGFFEDEEAWSCFL